MKTKIIIKMEIDSKALESTRWTDAFPQPSNHLKRAEGVKENDPEWLAQIAEFERKLSLSQKATRVQSEAAAHARRYCEVVGLSIGIGEHVPMVYSTELIDPTPNRIELRRSEMKAWLDKVLEDAKEIYKKLPPDRDFMQKEMNDHSS